MQEFVRQQNIAEFRRLLTMTTDEYQWRVLLKLLAEEEAKAPPPVKAPDDDSRSAASHSSICPPAPV
jgi:hypothetical protein